MLREGGLEAYSIPELVLNNIPTGIIFCDIDCIIRFVNNTYAEYLGVSPHDAVGRPITDFIPGSRACAVMKSGKAELGDRCPIEDSSGKKIKTLIVNRIPVKGPDGKIIGMISQTLFGDPRELREVSERIEHLEKKVSSYREKMRSVFSPKYSLPDIKGQSAGIVKAKELITHYAKRESPVLIHGATGTGKEMFASALHLESLRYKHPFVSINCAAIPHELLESELFGYAPGAFTGAQRDGKMGQIELADKGTLFLDEIGDMPLQAQAKLLRVLEDKIVYRLGSTMPYKVDFRLAAATNQDLSQLINAGKFRQDLYYRLSALTVTIPPLRQRKEDIPVLVREFLERSNKPHLSWSSEAIDALIRYHWPGNVRELRNVVERAISICGGNLIEISDLPAEVLAEIEILTHSESATPESSLSGMLAGSEQRLILNALKESNWNMVKAAKMLGISRATLYEKTKKYTISRSRK